MRRLCCPANRSLHCPAGSSCCCVRVIILVLLSMQGAGLRCGTWWHGSVHMGGYGEHVAVNCIVPMYVLLSSEQRAGSCRAFGLDCNAICTFVHHLCESAVQALPQIVSENRFRVIKKGRNKPSDASEVVLEPLLKVPRCYTSTHARFEKANLLTVPRQQEACKAELLTMQRGVMRVRNCRHCASLVWAFSPVCRQIGTSLLLSTV